MKSIQKIIGSLIFTSLASFPAIADVFKVSSTIENGSLVAVIENKSKSAVVINSLKALEKSKDGAPSAVLKEYFVNATLGSDQSVRIPIGSEATIRQWLMFSENDYPMICGDEQKCTVGMQNYSSRTSGVVLQISFNVADYLLTSLPVIFVTKH